MQRQPINLTHYRPPKVEQTVEPEVPTPILDSILSAPPGPRWTEEEETLAWGIQELVLEKEAYVM